MKKILLLLCLGLLALAPSACAVQYFGTVENNNQAGRVLILTPAEAENPAAYSAAQALSQQYGRYLLHRELDAAALADPNAYSAAVLAAVADADAQAVILAPAYAGAAAACGATEALTIALQPKEAPALIAGQADLVVAPDYAAIGEVAVAEAVSFSAGVLVYYQRGGFAYSEALLARTQAEAEKQGLDFRLLDLPKDDSAINAFLDDNLETLEKAVLEKVLRSETPLADDGSCGPAWSGPFIPALFSDDPALEETLLRAALNHSCICLPLPGLSPYGAFSRVFDVPEPGDLTQGLYDYLQLLNLEIVAHLERPWNFATWRLPLDTLELNAAADYAFRRLAQPEAAIDFSLCLRDAYAKQTSTYDQDGEAYGNYWLHLISVREFGESGCG